MDTSAIPLLVQRLTPHARVPQRATAGSAGYDLFADETTSVPRARRRLIKIGLSLNIGPGRYGRIAPRSGLAFKHGIDVLAGVIDADFRGEVGVILVNHTDTHFSVERAIGLRSSSWSASTRPPVHEVVDVGATERGHAGFGSTGK